MERLNTGTLEKFTPFFAEWDFKAEAGRPNYKTDGRPLIDVIAFESKDERDTFLLSRVKYDMHARECDFEKAVRFAMAQAQRFKGHLYVWKHDGSFKNLTRIILN